MLAKDSMSVKAETIKIGGLGVPPIFISEAFFLRENLNWLIIGRDDIFSMLSIQMANQRQFLKIN